MALYGGQQPPRREGYVMRRPIKKPPEVTAHVWALLDEFYKRGVTKKQMKDLVDVWWKVSDALGKIKQ